ncbi:MAG TPA: nuclear transport factor 2 family protein [Longimicrobiaceae bacterium]|jgi:ketosteroid isomerase-like protein|nr:nuclear transport factor 2 family protein [Longimicrobiaceae bacterium]
MGILRTAGLAILAASAFSLAEPRTLPAQANGSVHHATSAGDSAAVAEMVERFHRALAEGDSAAALALLASDVLIQESGEQESRSEYRSRHLAADIEFARTVRTRQGQVHVRVRRDVAWASSTSTSDGTFRGRAISSAGAELMVLAREAGAWRITAIHWSSHPRR